MQPLFRSALFVAFSLAVVPATGAQEKSWQGESVLYTKPSKDIQFGDVVDGKQIYFPLSGIMPIPVRAERDGWLRIHDGYREGWVDKADFVLARDAPAFFHRRVQANPKDTWALYMCGSGWLRKGEFDNAIKDFDEYIRLDPTIAAGYISRGIAWGGKKDHDKAIVDYNEAIRLDPNYALTYNNRGNVWSNKKDHDKAIVDYNEAIRLDPKYLHAYSRRGQAQYALRKYDGAIATWQAALIIDPDYSWATIRWAHLMATCPAEKYRDSKKALELAKKALTLEKNPEPAFQELLAAVFADSGDFAEAVRWQEKALEDPELRNDADARRRLELYRDKKPYRQE